MSLWEEIQKGHTVTWDPNSKDNLDKIKKAMNDIFNRRENQPRQCHIYMNMDMVDIFNEEMEYLYNPTPELKAKREARALEVRLEFEEKERIARERFVQLYGQEELDFILSLGKDINFRRCKEGDWNFTWGVPSEDEYVYYYIAFHNGVYLFEGDGGYGHAEPIESNITKERVLELIKEGYNTITE